MYLPLRALKATRTYRSRPLALTGWARSFQWWARLVEGRPVLNVHAFEAAGEAAAARQIHTNAEDRAEMG
jgi:hypothetical protein